MNTTELMAKLQAKYPYEKEYLQAVHEVLESIEDTLGYQCFFAAVRTGSQQNFYLAGTETLSKISRRQICRHTLIELKIAAINHI